MNSEPAHRGPDPGADPPGRGQEGDPASQDADWAEWLAYREQRDDDEPLDFEDDEDWDEDPAELAAIVAEARQAAADNAAAEAHTAVRGQTAVMAAVASAMMGRRGPGMPGSADPLAGEYGGPAGAFATGQALDTAAGGPVLLAQAEYAAGDDDRFDGAPTTNCSGSSAPRTAARPPPRR